jgi:hypothetical protein
MIIDVLGDNASLKPLQIRWPTHAFGGYKAMRISNFLAAGSTI